MKTRSKMMVFGFLVFASLLLPAGNSYAGLVGGKRRPPGIIIIIINTPPKPVVSHQ